MRFLSIYKTDERNTPPTQEEMAAMGKLIEEGMKGLADGNTGMPPFEAGSPGSPIRGQGDRDRWSFYRVERTGGRVRHPEGGLEGRGNPAGEELFKRGWTGGVRVAPAL